MSFDDPYRHHPNLRGKIKDPEDSFFRDFRIESLIPRLEERGLPLDWWYSDEERETMRARDLAGRMDSDLWVFGYGSLMWDPAFNFAEVRRARLPEYARSFILLENKGGRGTVERPGLVAALDKGAGCDGMMFRIAQPDVDAVTENLWRREIVAPGYVACFSEAHSVNGAETTLCFVADHSSDSIVPDLPYDKTVEYIATAEGELGTNYEYLAGVVSQCRVLGIEDPEMEQLLVDVDAYRARNG